MEATIKPFKFFHEGAVFGQFRMSKSLLPRHGATAGLTQSGLDEMYCNAAEAVAGLGEVAPAATHPRMRGCLFQPLARSHPPPLTSILGQFISLAVLHTRNSEMTGMGNKTPAVKVADLRRC